MNKFRTYFGQVITDTELNEILGELVSGIERFIQDFGYSGIASGAVVTRHEPPGLSVDVSGPAIVYDQQAQRISFGSTQVVDCSVDETTAPTMVTTSGNEKWLAVFVKFVSIPNDPRENDLGESLYYRQIGGFQLRVAQGAEASVGAAGRVPLRGDHILLADVHRTYGQTQILEGDISLDRRETIYALTGEPLSIRAMGLQAVLQAMLDSINTVRGEFEGSIVSALANVTQLAANLPIVGTSNDAADHLGNSNNVWKLILRMPCSDGTWVRLYSGSGAASFAAGNWCVTSNALWDPGPVPGGQKWSQDQSGEANMLRGTDGELHWYGRLSGSPPWITNEWDDSNRGVLRVGNTIASQGTITAALGIVATSGDISALTGSVYAGQNLSAGHDLSVINDAFIGRNATAATGNISALLGDVLAGVNLGAGHDLSVINDAFIGRNANVTTGNLTVNAGKIVATLGDIEASNHDVLAGRNLSAGGYALALNNVYAGGDFRYRGGGTPEVGGMRLRTTPILHSDMYGDYQMVGHEALIGVNGMGWPVRLPAGAKLGDIEIQVMLQAAPTCRIRLLVRTPDWSHGPTPDPVNHAGDYDFPSPAGPGLVLAKILCGGVPVLAGAEYSVFVNYGSIGDSVAALRMVDWQDPGPRTLGF